MREHSHDTSGCNGLQNHMDLQEDVPGVYSKMCPGSSHEGNGGISIKSEVIDVELVEEYMPIPLPRVTAEHEVSFS
jgi:hypothetical protein